MLAIKVTGLLVPTRTSALHLRQSVLLELHATIKSALSCARAASDFLGMVSPATMSTSGWETPPHAPVLLHATTRSGHICARVMLAIQVTGLIVQISMSALSSPQCAKMELATIRTALSFYCTCNLGSFIKPDGGAVFDECANCKTNDCDINADCKNTAGSYTCDCGSGFFRNGTRGQCVDVCQAKLDQLECDTHSGCSLAFTS